MSIVRVVLSHLRSRRVCSFLLGSACVTSALLAVQIDAVRGDDGPAREQLVAAYELTKDSPTYATYCYIIQVCDEALAGELNAEDRRYARQLASWAYTKRADSVLDLRDSETVSDPLMCSDLDNAIEYDSNNWKARLLRGIVHGASRRFDDAIKDLDVAIRLNEKSGSAWYNRAELRYQVGDFVLANHDYGRAIALNPRDTAAYVGRGHSYFELGKFIEALGDYQKVVLLTAGSADALLFRGDTYSALAKWELARDDYQLAVARAPESSRARQKLAWLLATCSDQAVGNPAQALTLARTAHELDATSWDNVQTLATALSVNDQTADAIELIEAWARENSQATDSQATALLETLKSQIR